MGGFGFGRGDECEEFGGWREEEVGVERRGRRLGDCERESWEMSEEHVSLVFLAMSF